MARRGRRKFRRYLRGQIDFQLPLLTLATEDVVGANVSDTVVEKAWISSVRATHTLSGAVASALDGPILVGVAHSDYTDAEIEAWIENSESWNARDLVAQEAAKRKIRRIGVFNIVFDDTGLGSATLNDGKPITTKCNWMLQSADTVKFWAYNMGAAIIITGYLYDVQGHANLWPN